MTNTETIDRVSNVIVKLAHTIHYVSNLATPSDYRSRMLQRLVGAHGRLVAFEISKRHETLKRKSTITLDRGEA